jgi:hypothetical protein
MRIAGRTEYYSGRRDSVGLIKVVRHEGSVAAPNTTSASIRGCARWSIDGAHAKELRLNQTAKKTGGGEGDGCSGLTQHPGKIRDWQASRIAVAFLYADKRSSRPSLLPVTRAIMICVVLFQWLRFPMLMPLSAADRLDHFEIVASIGRGGMGEVYKARDVRLDRLVAIKISSEKFSPRFELKARAMAALNHLHICQLYDIGPDYLVMEYVEGSPLKGPLPFEKVVERRPDSRASRCGTPAELRSGGIPAPAG